MALCIMHALHVCMYVCICLRALPRRTNKPAVGDTLE